jgi:hypothetical protein
MLKESDLWKIQMRCPMNTLLLVFMVALIQDTLSGYHLNLVGQGRILFASIVFGVGVFLGYVVFMNIWEELTRGNYLGILVYALGCTVGHYIGLSIKSKKD